MGRAERQGLGLALAGHVLLFALLSTRVFVPATMPVPPKPIEVTFADQAALEPAAPKPAPTPAPSRAPDPGPPEDAAPPEPAPPEPKPAPKPAPPAPKPKPAPPEPAPKPVAKPAPVPKPVAKPEPAPKPTPKPVAKPEPTPKPKPLAKSKPEPTAPVPAKPAAKTPAKPAADPAPAKTAAREAAGKPATARPAATAAKGIGANTASTRPRPTGSRLGDDFLKGLKDDPGPSQSDAPVAPKLDAVALGAIQDAIRRQIQPCADRQVDPGPGANQIVTVLNLRLNPDGTLAATPTMVRQQGVDDENGRYSRRVVDLGIAAFKGCAPLKLPPEYYRTPSGGWNNINYRWQLRE